MKNLKRIILLLTCLTIVVPFVHGQETQTVLKPNQKITFSLDQIISLLRLFVVGYNHK